MLFVCDAKYVGQIEENGANDLMETVQMLLSNPEFNSLSYQQQYNIIVHLYTLVDMYHGQGKKLG